MQDITITALVQIALAVNLGALCAILVYLGIDKAQRYIRTHSMISHEVLETLNYERETGQFTFPWLKAVVEPDSDREPEVAEIRMYKRDGSLDMRYKVNLDYQLAQE